MTATNMSSNSGLTGPHLNIAAFPGTPLRVMAGPGTGKTFALMRRIARLLQNGVPPQSILAVTFTRTAAGDLLDQLHALGSEGANNVRSSTLHSISFSILSKNSVFQATNRVARPLLQFETNCLISDLAISHGGRRAAAKFSLGLRNCMGDNATPTTRLAATGRPTRLPPRFDCVAGRASVHVNRRTGSFSIGFYPSQSSVSRRICIRACSRRRISGSEPSGPRVSRKFGKEWDSNGNRR